jgi:hypothetical protein
MRSLTVTVAEAERANKEREVRVWRKRILRKCCVNGSEADWVDHW